MDTLVCSAGDDREPAFFATKMLLLPHLQSTICGTGALPVILDWYLFVQSCLIGYDVRVLVEYGEKQLPTFWPRYAADHPGISTTIYHLGWDVAESRFRAFKHESGANFVATELAYGAYMKPPVLPPPEIVTLPASFIDLMHRQRAAMKGCPPEDRVGIGGEIQFLVMTQSTMVIETSHRFDDFDDSFGAMLARSKRGA